MENIIAEIYTPKQRMTQKHGYILRENADGTYSVHCRMQETGAEMYGHYDLTLDAAWKIWSEKAIRLMQYGTASFDTTTKAA